MYHNVILCLTKLVATGIVVEITTLDRFWFTSTDSTTGLTCIVAVMKGLGKKIAQSLKAEGVSGVILTST